jgi:hypothetical protein
VTGGWRKLHIVKSVILGKVNHSHQIWSPSELAFSHILRWLGSGNQKWSFDDIFCELLVLNTFLISLATLYAFEGNTCLYVIQYFWMCCIYFM